MSNYVVDHDGGSEFLSLSPEQEANSRVLTMMRMTEWINNHPNCTVNAYKEAKKDIRNQALIDASDGVIPKMFIGTARARYNSAIASVYELAEYEVISAYNNGNSVLGISRELDIPQITVRDMISKYRARKTSA
jgi:hypothetical protein